MRLEQLKYIVKIAETGTFTEASAHLFIAQPSISEAVHSLEKELHTKIFMRYRTGAVPTAQGVKIIHHAQRILNEIEEIKDLTIANTAAIEGEINIGTIPSLGTVILPKVINSYREKFPKIRIKIDVQGSTQITEKCEKGALDTGLVSVHERTDFNAKLLFTPLWTGKLMAYVGKKSPLANRRTILFRELLPYELFLFGKEFSLHRYCLDKIGEYGTPRVMSTTQNPEMIKRFVMQTDTVGFGPDISLKEDIYVRQHLLFPIEISDAVPIKFGTLLIKTKKQKFYVTKFDQELQRQKGT